MSHNNALLMNLRSETRAHHDRVELAMGLGDDFTIDRYIHALQAFEAYLTAWQPAIAAVLTSAERVWLSERSRTDWARNDLKAFGAPARPELVRHLNLRVPSRAYAYGSMYVIEGSTLGGQIIAGRVPLRYRVEPGSGTQFFGGRGEKTGAMWREFRLQFVRELRDAGAYIDAKAGAEATFDELTSVVQRWPQDSVNNGARHSQSDSQS